MSVHEEKQKGIEQMYFRGHTTVFASRTDPRFPYALFVPHRFDRIGPGRTRLLVAVHGTGRTHLLYRDLFAEFADYHDCIVIAPLFPANVLGDGNLHGYKFIEESGIRYDRIMLGIIDEVAERFGLAADRVLMFGFSGGAHFTHRFTILHPGRIEAASIAAPGSVTLLDPARPWWTGIADVNERFGIRIAGHEYRNLALHFVVGTADLETWEITFNESDRYYMPGANDAGRTRIDRIRALADSFRRAGARVRLDTVPGVAHDVAPLALHARQFFHDVIAGDFDP
ncbi:MAG TPA: hypothetical protein VKZ85_09735 [Woeseiaceae bacterium]|nr:hypothetical protein [Woeseiaceae bacterium]